MRCNFIPFRKEHARRFAEARGSCTGILIARSARRGTGALAPERDFLLGRARGRTSGTGADEAEKGAESFFWKLH